MNLVEYFRGDGKPAADVVHLPRSVSAELDRPEGYKATPPVKAAVNVALNLGLPLLVTGEPGTGKSVLARAVAHELDLQLVEFVAKSNTSATDLLYRFDAVRHFRDAQIEALAQGRDQKAPAKVQPIAPYLRFEALGRAIALTYEGTDPDVRKVWDDEANLTPGEAAPRRGKRSVVLIDELDKAPRDVPNDLLVEIERRSFRVTEAGQRLSVQNDLHPIVIVTSNSEKSLPDAFLRRCVFHHIEFPNDAELTKIVASRIADLRDGPPKPPAAKAGDTEEEAPVVRQLAKDGIALLRWLRPETDGTAAPLRKPPSVAELLAWLQLLLRAKLSPNISLKDAARDRVLKPRIEQSLGVLLKDRADWQRVTNATGDRTLHAWANSRS